MKLVEILARELKEWPACKCITQNASCELVKMKSADVCYNGSNWLGTDGVSIIGFIEADQLSSDHCTAIITRADWEAERARIKGKKAMPKANKDGWIRHRGGKCPIKDRSTYINGRFRSGEQYHGPAYGVAWSHAGKPSDLMAWRLHKPEQPIEPAVVANVEAFNAQAEIKTDGPLQWRDRIREINGLLGDLRAEKANLIARLEKEGFALIDEKPF